MNSPFEENTLRGAISARLSRCIPANLREDLERSVVASVVCDLADFNARTDRQWVMLREAGLLDPAASENVINEGLFERLARDGVGANVISDDQLVAVATNPVVLRCLRDFILGEYFDGGTNLAAEWRQVGELIDTPRSIAGGLAKSADISQSDSQAQRGSAEFATSATVVLTPVSSTTSIGNRRHALDVRWLFDVRQELGAARVESLRQLPEDLFQALIAELEAAHNAMATAHGKEWFTYEEHFHGFLDLAGVDPSFTDQFNRVLLHFGINCSKDPAIRAAIIREHKTIIQHLKARQFDKAAEALINHLSMAFWRWFPHLADEIALSNAGWFNQLRKGDSFVLLLRDVPAIEWLRRYRDSIGYAAATAIGRGAALRYVYHSRNLLACWHEEGIGVNPECADEIESAFSGFRAWVVSLGLCPTDADPEDWVDSHLKLVCVDDPRSAALVRSAATIGYFNYLGRGSRLTERRMRGHSAAWDEIELSHCTDVDKSLFLRSVREAVVRTSRSSTGYAAQPALSTFVQELKDLERSCRSTANVDALAAPQVHT